MQSPEGPDAVAANHGFTIDAKTAEQLTGSWIRFGCRATAGLSQGSRTPETNGSHIGLQRLHQRVQNRRVWVIAQAPGRCLADEGVAVDLEQLQQRLHGRWGRVASQGINSAHPLDWAGLLQQRQQQWHRPRIAVLTEHLQTLQPLIVTLLEQDQPPITSPGRLERVFLSVIDGDCIQGVTVQLRRQLPGQQLRIKRQACKALIP